MKTAKMIIKNYKSPDAWGELLYALGLYGDNDTCSPIVGRYFEYGEYASIEIEVDENLNIVGGRILPKDEE